MYKEKMIKWIVGDDVGISSKTIWVALMGISYPHNDRPYDADDFGRCYRLVKSCGITKDELLQVARVYPYWKPIIDNWDKLCAFFEQGHGCYNLLESLEGEINSLKGMRKVREGYWVQKKEQ